MAKRPKPIHSKSLERICAYYAEIKAKAAAISNLNARSSEDMAHDAILLAAKDNIDDVKDADIVDYVLYRMNTIIWEAKKKQAAYSNANDIQAQAKDHQNKHG